MGRDAFRIAQLEKKLEAHLGHIARLNSTVILMFDAFAEALSKSGLVNAETLINSFERVAGTLRKSGSSDAALVNHVIKSLRLAADVSTPAPVDERRPPIVNMLYDNSASMMSLFLGTLELLRDKGLISHEEGDWVITDPDGRQDEMAKRIREQSHPHPMDPSDRLLELRRVIREMNDEFGSNDLGGAGT